MYTNMGDYTFSFSTSTFSNSTYPFWENATSNAEHPRPWVVLDGSELWVDGTPFWNVTRIDLEEEHVDIEELDAVLEEVS